MSKKRFFFFALILFLTAFLSHAQQMGLYPLTQYSVGGTKGTMQLRTTATAQQDTLKIPFIEDFSGPSVPIKIITPVLFGSGPAMVYQITCVKMHGLKSNTNIRVFSAAVILTASAVLINGSKYVKVIDKYTFQLFDDITLTTPTPVVAEPMRSLNWTVIGAPGYSTVPDTLGFLDNNGGVFINNDMAVNPVNIGVATFDGVKYNGIPYSTNTTKGYGDNLTSLPFNLLGYNPIDSIYMSFYWQIKGLGDAPIPSEFLSLELKNSSGAWVEVWRKYGSNEQDTFKLATVAIKNSVFLHKGFQYRFRSYGILNGRFNVWNLDYIYINKNRRAGQLGLKDVAIISTNTSALINYTAIPYKHFNSLSVSTITSETGPASMTIRDSLNIYPSPQYSISRQHRVRDNLGHNSIKYEDPNLLGGQGYVFTQPFKDTIPGGYMTAPYSLKEEFLYQPLDTIGPIDLSFNNFTSIETFFYETYSYDDGIPEMSFLSINPGGTKIANAYKILKTDQLTDIEYCFIRNNGPDMTNTTIFLNVWQRDSSGGVGPNDPYKLESIWQQPISIAYSTDINGFVRYALTTPVQLNAGGTYYFGYTQNASNALYLGYDRNNDHFDKIFFCNDGTTWHPFSDIRTVPGSLMIHPVFSDGEIITSIGDKETQQNQFTFYPNPAKSELHITGQPEYISIYDLSGLLLLEKIIVSEEVLSTETLNNGLYLVILSKGDYKEVKRLIIQK